MSTRLWDKGQTTDARVLAFTVGNDPQVDLYLLPWDCIGSAAHARMLGAVGLLEHKDVSSLCAKLGLLFEQAVRGEVVISLDQEDCHTAIESYLTKELGDAGARIHTGRSRNDQVLLASRLYMRGVILSALEQLVGIADEIGKRFAMDTDLPLPGYTHLQPAMPSSVGMWWHAQYEAITRLIEQGLARLLSVNSNPLGAGAGFDTPLPLNRKLVAELLALERVDRSPIDAQNSRGRLERELLFWFSEMGAVVEKLSWDLQMFHMREFQFISLPDELTTGSSIMPQKRNPDVLELLRGRCASLRGCLTELQWVSGKLPSNYHRDLQLVKEPLVRGVQVAGSILDILPLVVQGVCWNKQELASKMHDELYATYDAFRRVRQGVPFRTAYKETAAAIAAGKTDFAALRDDFKEIAQRTALGFQEAMQELAGLKSRLAAAARTIRTAEAAIFCMP
ncbi:MAG: lyase family protein [Bdellovibrionota bacterium]|nr:MAG: lyase family protein [Bdellovibrionota bacterium]